MNLRQPKVGKVLDKELMGKNPIRIGLTNF